MNKKFSLKTVIALMLIASAFTCILLFGGAALYLGADSNLLSDIRTYAALRRDIRSYYIGDYQEKDISTAAMDAAVNALNDRWSYYMTPEEYQKYLNSSNNQYSGIGVAVNKDTATGGMRITSVYTGSPAEEAGVKAGDIVIAIDGADITKLPLSDATALVDRQLGQTVRLTLLGEDGMTRDADVVYRLIDTNPVSYELLDGKTGYIAVKNFESGAADKFTKAADDLVAQGASSFVFDLRNNGGGKVSELKTMLDYLLPECDIFVAVAKNGIEDVTSSGPENVKLPAVVMVNAYSFSAAEYFAAVLQEYGYAQVVGQHTTGKNRSQITLTLPNGGALHISSGEYLTPRRVSLAVQGGIAPDYEVLLPDNDNVLLYGGKLDRLKDTQLHKAIELLKQS
jgi:carboxyl-terminal processing protease